MSGGAPRAGDRVTYRGEGGTVVRIEGNLCWTRYDADPDTAAPFIWRFHNGELNRFHDWPGKLAADQRVAAPEEGA